MSGRILNISNTCTVNCVDDGENAIVLTLDNEHEDFLYNDAGSNLTGTVTSQARLMDGGTAVQSGVTYSISDDGGTTWKAAGTSTTTNSTANINSSGLLTVTALKANVVKITVRALYNGNYYYKDFTANKTSSDTYELVLTPSSMTYNPATWSQKTTAQRTITASVMRLDKQGVRSELTFGSYTNPSKISSTDGKGYLRLFVTKTEEVYTGQYARRTHQMRSATDYAVIDAISASNDDEISFKLCKYANYNTSDSDGSNGTLVDFQSVPIPKAENGQQGEQGQQGERGKVGRWFYYAGVFDENNTTKQFLLNDAQAPYFLTSSSGNTKHYHVFDYETNGSYTMAQMWDLTEETGTPPTKSFNNAPWVAMWSDFEYIITKAIFGDYAHFGSAIINGDFLMSQLGYIRGFNGFQQDISTDETYYTNFNSFEPFGTEELRDYSPANADQWLVNDGGLYNSIGTGWTQIGNSDVSSFKLESGVWYTFEVDGYCDGGTLDIKISTSSPAAARVSLSINRYTTDTTFYPAYVTFKLNSTATGCKIFAKQTDLSAVHGVFLRKAQFVPNFVVDMRTGEMAANKLNGRLRAKYFDYDTTMKRGIENVIVENESFVCLTNDAETLIILPRPTASKGRVIEIFNASPNWGLKWDGATSADHFKVATRSINNDYRTWKLADGSSSMGGNYVKYLKLWCDGQIWWVIDYNYGENPFEVV